MNGWPAWNPAFIVGALAGLVTLAGGLTVLRLRSALELCMALAAGALIGVALFDLMPEALSIAAGEDGRRWVLALVGAGFALYLLLERAPTLVGRAGAGVAGPATLTVHSLLDGLGMGVAFQASKRAGIVVALAVLAHDLVDGGNTVTLSLRSNPSRHRARAWLAADAIAPLAGVALSMFAPRGSTWIAALLALFAGFFLYIGAAELLPRSQRERPGATTLVATLAAMALMGAVSYFGAG